MAKRVIVTDEEGRARLVREMEALKYHMGAMNKHGTLALAIATEYKLITATGLGSWQRWAGNWDKWAIENIKSLLYIESDLDDWDGQRWQRRYALALNRAKQAIRREKMK